MDKLYQNYVQQLQKIMDIESAIAVLSWDKETYMPPKGAAFRAQQIATLSGMAHELSTSDELGDLLEQLSEKAGDLEPAERINVARTREDYARKRTLDAAFVMEQSRIVSATYQSWTEAKKQNDFGLYADNLEKLVASKREEAERRGYTDHPYDALLDLFEPGYTSAQLDTLFADVRQKLVDFVRELRDKPQVDDRFLEQHFDKDKQWAFGMEILRRMGYDLEAGRQDLSTHPFTTTFSAQDVRVTTRISEQFFNTMTWSCIHEGGHALYEQGLPAEQYGLPGGQFTSLGIHESQSRLWENQVGRSLGYWKAQFPLLQEYFSEQFKTIEPEAFFKAINKIYPHPIRVESDELHYHFHILIRYEIEKALIEGSMEVKDIPSVWNAKYKKYLDLDIKDDRQGCLQDIHWAIGSMGYFPTYSLGSFYAAQFYAQAEKDIPELAAQIERGDSSQLLAWLRENIHQHGRQYSADELCKRITGSSLNFDYFMDYARKKYAQIY